MIIAELCLLFGIEANYGGGGDMSRRQAPNYGPGPGPVPVPGGPYQMQGHGYQATQYGSGGYGSGGYGSGGYSSPPTDIYDAGSASSYPTAVCRILHY